MQAENSYYKKEDMAKVKEANDIVDVIREFTPLKGKNGLYRGECVFHEDKEKSLLVSQEKQVFQCISCGEGGDVYSFVMKAKGLSLTESIACLAERAHIELPPPKLNKSSMEDRADILAINKEAAMYYHETLKSENGKEGMDYFKETRGLSKRTIARFGLGYAENRATGLYDRLKDRGFTDGQIEKSGLVSFYKGNGYDKFRGRVMNPVFDTEGNVVGFSGRVLDGSTPKYINSRETLAFDKKNNLYGLNFAKNSKAESMILCEGNLDVVSLHQAGFDNAVAPLGTAFTKEQAALLARYTGHVHLAFDSDSAGVRASLRAIPILKGQGIEVDIVHMGPYKDPDELLKAEGAGAFRKKLQEAESSYSFEAHAWAADYNLRGEEGYAKGISAFSAHLLDVHSDEWGKYTGAMEGIVAGLEKNGGRYAASPPDKSVQDEEAEEGQPEPGYENTDVGEHPIARFISEFEIECI